jgi:hypothetical protein
MIGKIQGGFSEWVSTAQNSIARQILECRVFYLPYMYQYLT